MTLFLPFLYSISVFQKCHLPFLLLSLNPIIVLLPSEDAVIFKKKRNIIHTNYLKLHRCPVEMYSKVIVKIDNNYEKLGEAREKK